MIIDQPDDTIVAIATPPGKSGIGIIRVSGADSVNIAGKICQFPKYKSLLDLPPNQMTFVRVVFGGRIIDEGMTVTMLAPRSFTGENLVELNLHGSPIILNLITEQLIKLGARPANPGEFTRRAFINGKVDLTRAEAIDDIIHAKTVKSAEMAANQLKGELYRQVLDFKGDISWILALLNAGIDFSDEDITFSEHEEITEKLSKMIINMEKILNDADTQAVFKYGINATLYGRPNAGKSSIMNRLLKKNRSIITDIPGTTRDTVSDYFDLNGIPIYLTDTAGIRDTADMIEMEGIRRARDSAYAADLVLWIIDCQTPFYDEDLSEFSDTVKILPIFNKTDLGVPDPAKLPERMKGSQYINICCLDEGDMNKLLDFIFRQVTGDMPPAESTISVNIRQKTCLKEALEQAKEALENHKQREFTEMVSHILSQSLYSLGAIIGETTPDEMLNRIFSNFCIGK